MRIPGNSSYNYRGQRVKRERARERDRQVPSYHGNMGKVKWGLATWRVRQPELSGCYKNNSNRQVSKTKSFEQGDRKTILLLINKA